MGITGSNKGIGLQVVRVLCRHFGQDGIVYLTARNEGRGLAAVELLQKEGLNPKFHLLDISDQANIDRFRDDLEKEHGGIDILINNAAVYLRGFNPEIPLDEESVQTIKVNFFGLRDVCKSLFPLVRSGGRIVNVASWLGYRLFEEELSDGMKERIRRIQAEEDIVELMNDFMSACKMDKIEESGWAPFPYEVSKLGVILLTINQASLMSRDNTKNDVIINSCCPGFVDTDMTSNIDPRVPGFPKLSVAEGADTPVYLALLPPGTKDMHGNFVMNRKPFCHGLTPL
ncbi:carbonyl reductase [NADPH] 1-like [Lytechinus variegatus]|uniref:carbonyl reductase [NADPH] 1-like n=1 Tax=Lytechinus variegatus TaxID=7654 RepID=UPI001BB12DD3|nr:carbonyl reductase [NADPH] 1-like [Lytechinus variegatus]